ncbi:MAG: PAS domain S-box protein, partial [Armatimonadota bacterium]
MPLRRLANLAGRAPMPVVGLDRDGRLIYVNDSLCALTGYDNDEMVGSFFWELIVEPEAERRRERFLRLRDEGDEGIDTRFDARIRTRDGDQLLIAWHNVPFLDEEGRLESVFSIGADITALRSAEDRLGRMNATLQALSGISGLALRIDDPRELLDRACEILVETGACAGAWIAPVGDNGRPIGLVGSSLRNGSSPEALQAAVAELPDCIAEVLEGHRQIAINEISEACADCLFAPEDRDVHGIASRVGHSEGVFAVLVTHVPNSEPVGEETRRLFRSIADDLGFALAMLGARAMHERTERSLAERTRMLDAFFENSLDPVAILDGDFNFVRVNQAYADADGRPPGDFVGRNHFELYRHEENQRIFERVRDTGEPFT